ncbi:hypothetical protein I4F81_000271 [Pyropia yezoensis]|uniref:Uncharacterized protein n=1 Tax=Pyropia yezoensis TaxID=2788 RepID=A0ACC3BID5_PYRYE|nr:hypothetical protein I4F81_000271 [Neopyropia yezoensis]
MEWVELLPFGASIPSVQAALGAALARTHADVTSPDGGYGFGVPTYLGATALDNRPSDDWADFFLTRRLRPALAAATAAHGGGPVAVDPASWYGDAEFDLAVSRLYGALGTPFAAAYAAAAGWGGRGEAAAVTGGRALRGRLYTAYQSVNQLNLHGAGYGREGGSGGGEYERAVRLLGEVVRGARDVM